MFKSYLNSVSVILKSQYMRDFYKSVIIYLLWIFLHWSSVQIYQNYCVPSTFWGMIFGATVKSQTPICSGILWLMNFTHKSITGMWVILGIWCSTRIINIASKANKIS